MRKILSLFLLATLLTLAALSQGALAGNRGQQLGQGTVQNTTEHAVISNSHLTSDNHDRGTNSGQNQETRESHSSETGEDHEPENEAQENGHEQELEVNATFHVRLVGSQQSPAVDTTAFGFAKVQLVQNGTMQFIRFRVIVCDIVNVTRSHIHVGAVGSNGDIIIHFFDSTTNPFSSPHGCKTLAHGIRTPNDLKPSSSGGINNWSDFAHALLTGNTYVNVHTLAHPNGEIRGQLIQHVENEDDQGEQVNMETGDDQDLPHAFFAPIIFLALND